jgi:hypothetical protein
MSLSRATLRLITVLFLLAGILLLRKPVFGEAIASAPTRFSVVIEGVAPCKGPDVILIPASRTYATPTPPRPNSSPQ